MALTDAEPSPRSAYTARINRVVDHISAHLADPLDLATLADVAHFSAWHFHRVFQAGTGETLADCVRRLRLEAAAQRLLTRPPRAALAIALDVGFASAEVFTRAFKAHFGVTPGAWRRGAWRHRAEQNAQTLSKIHQAVRKIHQDQVPQFGDDASIRPERRTTLMKGLPMQVELRTLPAMQLAYMRHTGPYGHPGIGQTWARFAPWAGAQGLLRPGRALLGISQDDPMVTPPEKCRYDCCVEVDAAFRATGEVGVQAFEGGRYACTRFTGTGADIHAAWMRMFAEWLPGSGWQPADRPALELYEPDFVVDKATGAFTCLLCVPVRAAPV